MSRSAITSYLTLVVSLLPAIQTVSSDICKSDMSKSDYMDKSSPNSSDCVGLSLLALGYCCVFLCTLGKFLKACRLPRSESLLRVQVFYVLISMIAGLRTVWLLDFAFDLDREVYAYLNIAPNSLLSLLGSVFTYFWSDATRYETITSTDATLSEASKKRRTAALQFSIISFNFISVGLQVLILNDYFHSGFGLAPFPSLWE